MVSGEWTTCVFCRGVFSGPQNDASDLKGFADTKSTIHKTLKVEPTIKSTFPWNCSWNKPLRKKKTFKTLVNLGLRGNTNSKFHSRPLQKPFKVLAILCDLFGMVKWPFEMDKWHLTRWSKGHFESPGKVSPFFFSCCLDLPPSQAEAHGPGIKCCLSESLEDPAELNTREMTARNRRLQAALGSLACPSLELRTGFRFLFCNSTDKVSVFRRVTWRMGGSVDGFSG